MKLQTRGVFVLVRMWEMLHIFQLVFFSLSLFPICLIPNWWFSYHLGYKTTRD